PGLERFFYFDPEKGLGPEITKAEIKSINAYDFNWSLSPDGQMLVFAKREGIQHQPALRILPLSDGPEKTILVPGWAGVGSVDWAAQQKHMGDRVRQRRWQNTCQCRTHRKSALVAH
ncbi:MAG: hypothetical protein WA628_08430, partial [Terriglobales bacterium]